MANFKSGFKRIGVVLSLMWLAFVFAATVETFFDARAEAREKIAAGYFADLNPRGSESSSVPNVFDQFEPVVVHRDVVVCSRTPSAEARCDVKKMHVAAYALLPLIAAWVLTLLLVATRWVYRGFSEQ